MACWLVVFSLFVFSFREVSLLQWVLARWFLGVSFLGEPSEQQKGHLGVWNQVFINLRSFFAPHIQVFSTLWSNVQVFFSCLFPSCFFTDFLAWI